ncbi:uncharacterized protein LOC106737847 isoform X1 [Alligator mississippiensis]|uniref:uncharacterized protein LOC106737847 isoform X1 n=1 Tax=Alligator mississippiensis TaxID=8496 RepID=UPI002877DC69|nr:uncharacterized protein LOC106737847 isoform X1 [Alligator mississippiensis]
MAAQPGPPSPWVPERPAGDELTASERWRWRFRVFRYQEAAGPREVCSRLRELCRGWLEPQRRSKEQMLELVVLEQFLAVLPREMQSWAWGHDVETCAEAVDVAEAFCLGLVPDEEPEVAGHRPLQDADVEGPGARPETVCTWQEPARSRPEHAPLEEAGWGKTPGPQEELPPVPTDKSAPRQEPAGAGTLSTAEEQPAEDGPVNLELLRPSPGKSGEKGLLTPELDQVHEEQGRCPQQRDDTAVNELQEAFEDVAVYFTQKEWELLEAGDKELYRDQMLRNYQALVSLGYQGPAPDLICRIQRGEMELWVGDKKAAGESSLSEDLSPESLTHGKTPVATSNFITARNASSRIENRDKCISSWLNPATKVISRNTPREGSGASEKQLLETPEGWGQGRRPLTALTENHRNVPLQNQNAQGPEGQKNRAKRHGKKKIKPHGCSEENIPPDPGRTTHKKTRLHSTKAGELRLVNKKPTTDCTRTIEKPEEEEENLHLLLKDHDYFEHQKRIALGGVGAHLALKDHDYFESTKSGSLAGVGRHIYFRNSARSALKDHDYCQSKRASFVQRRGGLRGMHHRKGGGDKPWDTNGRLTSKWFEGQKIRAWLKMRMRKAKNLLRKHKKSPRDGAGSRCILENRLESPLKASPPPEPVELENRDGDHDLNDPLESPLKASPPPEPAELESRDGDCDLNDQLDSPSEADPPGAVGVSLPDVRVVRVRRQDWPVARFGAARYTEEFRFVNLELVPLHVAYKAISEGIEQIIADLHAKFTPADYAQVRIEAETARNCLYSRTVRLNQMTTDLFVEWLRDLSQSQREIRFDSTFWLVAVVVRGVGGGGRRVINSIPYSELITRKRKYLIDLNTFDTNLCFAGSLLALTTHKGATDAVLLAGANQLHRKLEWPAQKKVMLNEVALFEDLVQVNIHIVMHKEEKGWGLFKTYSFPRYPNTCFLLLHDGHYYGVKDARKLFGVRNYCDLCHALYSHSHKCRFWCRLCLSPGCADNVGVAEKCPTCKLVCRSKECIDRHTALASEKQIDCLSKTWCYACQSYVDKDHECNNRQCKQCYGQISDADKHRCFMRKITTPEIGTGYICYDFECIQETEMHVPNYIFAMKLAPEKPWETEAKKAEDNWEFKGKWCVSYFIKAFITKRFQGYTFIAHNTKGRDNYFIVSQLSKERKGVKLIAQEGKLVCIEVTSLGIRFIDSSNFLPMKLNKLPQAMGFEGCRGYFPRRFNTPENQDYVGPLPEARYYGVESMMPCEKEEFLEWYRENRDKTFDLQKELAYYCQQDVKMLMEACRLYRKEIMKMTRQGDTMEKTGKLVTSCCIDPFQYITLASVCMATYRFMFLKHETIALLPPDNYHRQRKRLSSPSTQWLMYISEKENIPIQHALQGGEFQVGPYFLDGYANIDGKQMAFEFNSCFFRGCLICYYEKDWNPLMGTTYGFLNYQTLYKTDYLKRAGFTVQTVWEHEWRALLQSDRKLTDFLSRTQLPSPLVPRDALFGERAEAICLYYKTKPGEQIHYYNFTDLYPFVSRTKEYPVGHPEIIDNDFGPLSSYFGIAKVKLYPPRGLFFPVLPVKVNRTVMFPLCRVCAETGQQKCAHTDEERALVGTWCTPELNKAVEKGYKVAKIYEVWHFSKTTNALFSQYINLHLRQKQEASGYPAWCTDQDKRDQYVADFFQKEGVSLRQEHIKPNPAKHQIAELFLNSLWGQFGQRTDLPNTTTVRDPGELFGYLFSPSYDVLSCDFIDDETACVLWKHAKECYKLSDSTNIFIASFTTAYARLELYELLDRLRDRCLYHDTDSVIFVSRKGDWKPPLGDRLGELTSRIPANEHITEFVSAGTKTYAYKLSGGKACLKVKGITLDAAKCGKVSFETLRDLILDAIVTPGRDTPKTIPTRQRSVLGPREVDNTNQGLSNAASPL